MRALEEDTSVNAVLRDYLESYAGVRREHREAGRKLLDLAGRSTMNSGGEGSPRREELYSRKALRNLPESST